VFNSDVLRVEQFAALAHSAELASRRLGTTSASVLLAGLSVDIDFAGHYLYERMTRAFGHVLSSKRGESALRVTVWDEATSGVPLPPEVQPVWDHMAKSLGRIVMDDDIISYYDADAAALSYLDVAHDRALIWIEDAGALAERHRAAPIQTVLTWWLPRHRRFVVHAAAVGTEAGAVILCGSSGAGKSTTALSCLRDGFNYLSDDLCAVTTEDAVAVHSLYCTGKLHERHLADFPAFASIVTNRDRRPTEKAIAYLTDDLTARLRGSMPLRAAIVLANKIEGSPQLRRVPPSRALRAIAPNTLHGFPGFGREGFAGQAEFLSRVPCFEMDLSRDVNANPTSLRALLEEVDVAADLISPHGS
jgi:hypothetical protein